MIPENSKPGNNRMDKFFAGDEKTRLKNRVEYSYRRLLRTHSQPSVDFPEFKKEGGFVYCTTDIDIYSDFTGKSYLLGRIVDEENIGDGCVGLTIKTEGEGIELFEHYTKRSFRPIIDIPGDKGLIANLTAFKNADPEEDLEGYPIEKIIGLNFETYPVLKRKWKNSSTAEYKKFYLNLFKKIPIMR